MTKSFLFKDIKEKSSLHDEVAFYLMNTYR